MSTKLSELRSKRGGFIRSLPTVCSTFIISSLTWYIYGERLGLFIVPVIGIEAFICFLFFNKNPKVYVYGLFFHFHYHHMDSYHVDPYEEIDISNIEPIKKLKDRERI